jgi:hypothetical protein
MRKIILLVLFALVFQQNDVLSATRTWTGALNTTVWTSAGNWAEAAVPDETDSVIIGSSTIYPRVAGITAKCLHLMLLNNGTSNQVRLLINASGKLEIYGNLHNDYGYAGVFGSETDNPYLLFKKNTSSPVLARIFGNIKVGRIKVEKVTGFGLALSAGSHVTVDHFVEISGCTFDASSSGSQLLLAPHTSGASEGTSAFIFKGKATGHVVVTTPVIKPAGSYESCKHRYHYLGNPITDNLPHKHLDGHDGTINDDFAFYNPTNGTHGHPYYNSGYSFPATTSVSIYSSDNRNDCAIYPQDYYDDPGFYLSYSDYYNQAHACTQAINDQSPFFQYWDETVQDPWHSGSSANGTYGYKGFDSTRTFGKGEGMLTHFGPAILRTGDTNSTVDQQYAYIDWEGTVNDSTFSRYLTYTKNNEPDQDGYHLLGNPYPSPIDLGAFYVTNKDVISPHFEIWNGNNVQKDVNGGSTEHINIELDFDDQPVQQYLINIGQGFWARVKDSSSAGYVEFNNFQRSYDDFNIYNGAIYRKKTRNKSKAFCLNLQMTGKTTGSDETNIRLGDQYNQDVDGIQDASKLIGFGNALYTRFMGQRLALNSIPFPENRLEIPLEMIVQKQDEITLTAKDFRIPGGYQVNLLDKTENRTYSIQSDFAFTFTPKGPNSGKRFAVEIVPPGSNIIPSKTIRFTPFVNQDVIHLKLHDLFAGPATYQVSDISGRVLFNGHTSIQGAEVVLEKYNYPEGVLFVTLKPEGRPGYSQKCIFTR